MRSTLLSLVTALAALAYPAAAAEHTEDSLEKVKQNLKEKKAVLVDVREEKEWKAGHLESARLLPLSRIARDPDPTEVAKKLPKDRIIYLHCKAGGRCLIAADLLKDAGYDLRPLKAGYEDLLKAGFEKAKDEKAKKE